MLHHKNGNFDDFQPRCDSVPNITDLTDSAIFEAEAEFKRTKKLYDARAALNSLRRKYFPERTEQHYGEAK